MLPQDSALIKLASSANAIWKQGSEMSALVSERKSPLLLHTSSQGMHLNACVCARLRECVCLCVCACLHVYFTTNCF